MSQMKNYQCHWYWCSLHLNFQVGGWAKTEDSLVVVSDTGCELAGWESLGDGCGSLRSEFLVVTFVCLIGMSRSGSALCHNWRQLIQLDHEAQCPTLLALKVLFALDVIHWYLPASSWRDQVLGIKSKWLEISCQTMLFLPKVNQHNEPRSKLSVRANDMIYMLPLNETIQPVCSLCYWSHRPLLYSRWAVMDLLWWAHLFPHVDNVTVLAVLGVWERPALPASTSNWHSETQISSLELSPSCHHVTR